MRGFTFTLDSLVAFFLLLSLIPAFALVSSSDNSGSAAFESLYSQAQGAVASFSKLELSDVRRLPEARALFDSGFYSEEEAGEKTVMEAVGELWAAGNESLARNLSQAVFAEVLPARFGAAVAVEGETVYNSSEPDPERFLAASRRFVSGVNKSAPATGCIARAMVSNIAGKNEHEYAFFGGFTGQGNVTVFLEGFPENASFKAIELEANAASDFRLYVNGFDCGLFSAGTGNYSVSSWEVTDSDCLDALDSSGGNYLDFNFTGDELSEKFFGGGFVDVVYEVDELVPPVRDTQRVYLQGIDGLPNYYSSFFVPGSLESINASLHFYNNYTSYFRVGNTTLMHDNGSDEAQTVFIPNSEFASFFSFDELSGETVPIRFEVFANATGETGHADIVLITDVSGSMRWRMDSGNNGAQRACSDSELYDDDSERLSVAKCVDKDFIQAILEGVGNQVALVSFSSSVVNYTNFTNNSGYLNDTIDDYYANGGTCIACAINQARELLANSGPNRTRYVIVMSDGVATVRATETCTPAFRDVDFYNGSAAVAVGDDGYSLVWNGSGWGYEYVGSNSDFYAVSATLWEEAFAVRSSGRVYDWDGDSWGYYDDVGWPALYGVDVLDPSTGFAVGSSGHVYEWDSSGNDWDWFDDTGYNTFYDVDVFDDSIAFASSNYGDVYEWDSSGNDFDLAMDGPSWLDLYAVAVASDSLAFAFGESGRVYEWDGASWSYREDKGSNSFRDAELYGESFGVAVGDNGWIYHWDGDSWDSVSSPVSSDVYGVAVYNSSLAKAVTRNGEVLSWDGSSWSVEFDYDCDNGNETAGRSCGDSSSCYLSSSCPADNAVNSACWSRDEYNATVYSVGFGPVSSCNFANETLNAIAECGNGTYFTSSNASALADFYRSLARTIVRASNESQVLRLSGSINATLYPDSFIEYSFEPEQAEYSYGDLSLTIESLPLVSCSQDLFVPEQVKVDELLATSYSYSYWTHDVRLQNSLTGGEESAFNLSVYGSDYGELGDPFKVYFNSSRIASGEDNYFDVRTGSAPAQDSPECSTDNRIIYRGRVNAQVNYSSIFPACEARNATIYYDLDYDGVADGFVETSIGGSLPSAGEEFVSPEEFNSTHNGIDDALQRLLDKINFVNDYPSSPSGAIDNPVNLRLEDEIGSVVLVGQNVPFLWGPAEVTVMVWS